MEFFSALDYSICILFLLKMYSSINICIKYWMFQIMTYNKEDIVLILKTQSFYTKFKTRISRSVDIQIRPTFDLYCRLRNSFNFDQNMMFEWARLKTYKSAPETLCAWKIKLAKAGFFYTGVDHKCKCAFCGFSYDVLSETGDPDVVHRRLNPSCPFLVDRVNTNNIAIDADERALFQRRSQAFLTSSSRNFQYPAVFTGGHVSRFQTGGYAIDLDSTEEVDSYVRLIIQGLDVPPNVDRQISNTSERENRQGECPTNVTRNRYQGNEDHRVCFFCGLLIEQNGHNPETVEYVTVNTHKKSSIGKNGCTNNPAVQTLLDFGYESDVVKTTYTLLKDSGIHDITASLLLDTIYEKAEIENHNATSGQAIACPNSIPVKEPDDKEHPSKTPENTVEIDPTLELSLRNLEEENRNLKDQQTCKICLDEPVAIVFLPCGHIAACINCAPALRRCPICRAFIKGTVKAIMC